MGVTFASFHIKGTLPEVREKLNRSLRGKKGLASSFNTRLLHISYQYSHFVKFAHVVKLYVAYMRNLHIDKITPNLLHFAFDSYTSHICQDKQVTDQVHMFTVEKSGTGVGLQINYMSRVARKCFFGVHAPDSQTCVHVDTETNTNQCRNIFNQCSKKKHRPGSSYVFTELICAFWHMQQ